MLRLTSSHNIGEDEVKMETEKKKANDEEDFFPSQSRKRNMHTAYENEDDLDDNNESNGKKNKTE